MFDLYFLFPGKTLKPNLFILGAGKSGTTSLYYLLSQHPEIHVSAIKEPSFFCSHFQHVKNPIEYFGLFQSDRKYRVDSSHVYFSNPETPPILHALFPDAKFIVTLRAPEARAYSLYSHMRRFLHEDGLPYEPLATFEEALKAEDDRFDDPDFLVNCRQYFWNFMYCKSSMFDVQLQRYLSLFDSKQFFFMTLADLAKRPLETCNSLARFLEISSVPIEPYAKRIYNQDPAIAIITNQASDFMAEKFVGLTERVENILGRHMDWSL